MTFGGVPPKPKGTSTQDEPKSNASSPEAKRKKPKTQLLGKIFAKRKEQI